MFHAVEFPASIAYLATSLANMNRNALSHDVLGFEVAEGLLVLLVADVKLLVLPSVRGLVKVTFHTRVTQAS